MSFGHFIYAFRKALGLTQEEFSEKLEVQEGYARCVYPRYIQRWEHDEYRPRKATVLQIRMLNAPLFDTWWLSALRQHELQQFTSEFARSRESQSDYWCGF